MGDYDRYQSVEEFAEDNDLTIAEVLAMIANDELDTIFAGGHPLVRTTDDEEEDDAADSGCE